ncbi:uroporphyrinogen III decarboxylase, putative [Plasmodium berghei]|uniref:uroporphyrinogen decarboxylase n=2 Tax=Plasmodium berghei TaxID=5821 RepID=A0A509ABT6_PLABA|nr:uroporphyrinogen III decarboxylase [Plasmodium berghei ANKA]CXH81242.1 uroporphyrinogen III decarboxylase, putative [Plasmodium berghei]SCM19108.1 uroporphyrinogen III decarboxylase, putative [Plasmodium berghei]SCN21602.1 uroporphyrinogen III decarboxylase, putative [Plasmodium berghei]SCO58836.1 uroporphyrinogen III decarboxylase, putative [Plasmodium berghei]VUC53794.1 uroporphyrinogen III decarboxylase [Plasmodium berghei ANKA]|eukprot:XP_034419658.1 uroporphyrinogen III decarboxylase [Plasmodium berghei ANKA]
MLKNFVCFIFLICLLYQVLCFLKIKKIKLKMLKINTASSPHLEGEIYIRPESSKYEKFGRPVNDLILRVIENKDKEIDEKDEKNNEIPFWMMRQSGRYLPEYRELKKNYNFFDLCYNPELSSNITIMPYKRFLCDMVVIFSDILIIFIAMGIDIKFVENVGPIFNKEINNLDDFKKLNLNLKEIINNLHFVYDSINLTKKKINNSVPVLGFCGSPFTLFTYLTKDNASKLKPYENSLKLIYENSEDTHQILNILCNICISHLLNQIDGGANLIQIFDSNAEIVDKNIFKEFSLYYINKIVQAIKTYRPNTYIILFVKDNFHENIKNLDIDILSITHKQLINNGSNYYYDLFQNKIILQGALDPHILLLDNKENVQKYTSKMIQQISYKNKYIANLGHGILPNSKIENVYAFIQAVKSVK